MSYFKNICKMMELIGLKINDVPNIVGNFSNIVGNFWSKDEGCVCSTCTSKLTGWVWGSIAGLVTN